MGILWTLFATLFVAVLGGVALSALGAWNEHQRIAAAKETERRMGPRRRVVGEFTTPSRKQAPALVNQQAKRGASCIETNISISSVSQLAPAISNKSRLRSSHLKQEVGGESERRSEDEPSVEDMVVEPGAEQEGDFVRDAIDIKRKVDQTQAAYQEFPHRTSTAASPTPGGKRRRPSQDTTLPQPSTPNEAALTKRLSKIRKATHADSSTPSTPQRAVSRIGTPATGTKRKQSAGATPGPQRGSGGISLFQDEDEYTPDEDAEDARVRRETGMRAEDGWVTPFSYRKRRRGENGVVMLGKEDMEPVASAPRARVAPGTTPRGRVRISSGTPLKEIVDRRAVVGSKMPMPLLYRGPNEEEVQRILRASLSSGVDEPAGKGDAMEKKSVKFADEGGGSLEAGPSPSLGAKSGGVIVAADVMPVKFVGFGDGVLATSTPVVGAVAESASAASSSHPASPAGFSLLNANSATTSDSSKSSGGGFSFSAAPASAAPAVGSFGTTSNTTTPATGSSEVAASGGFSLGASTTPAPAPSASVSAEAPKSAAGFSFGNATAITPSPAEAPQTGGFSFSATAPAGPVEDTPQTAAPFSFGTHTPAATEAPKSQGFGGFGSSSVTPAPAPATSAAPSAFSFGNTPSSSSSVPAFGQQPTAVTPAFGAPAATQPISGPLLLEALGLRFLQPRLLDRQRQLLHQPLVKPLRFSLQQIQLQHSRLVRSPRLERLHLDLDPSPPLLRPPTLSDPRTQVHQDLVVLEPQLQIAPRRHQAPLGLLGQQLQLILELNLGPLDPSLHRPQQDLLVRLGGHPLRLVVLLVLSLLGLLPHPLSARARPRPVLVALLVPRRLQRPAPLHSPSDLALLLHLLHQVLLPLGLVLVGRQ
ncbi:hypothetical protein BC830DRAFT_454104 [Chytriomyces sp. MP71]|nr:hypothetical protein BC830DRAFT_454104 [Chytriomyces sp. MP71]